MATTLQSMTIGNGRVSPQAHAKVVQENKALMGVVAGLTENLKLAGETISLLDKASLPNKVGEAAKTATESALKDTLSVEAKDDLIDLVTSLDSSLGDNLIATLQEADQANATINADKVAAILIPIISGLGASMKGQVHEKVASLTGSSAPQSSRKFPGSGRFGNGGSIQDRRNASLDARMAELNGNN